MKTRMTKPAAIAPAPASKAASKAASKPRPARGIAKLWQLRLYVTGQSGKSRMAFTNLKTVCETHLKGRYSITVIDLLKEPGLAKGDQILAIPTVIRKLPKPVRIIIGTLSDLDHLLVGLDLRPADQPEPRP